MAEVTLASLREQATRALLLDPEVFSEVASDEGATQAALVVVFIVAVAEGLGRVPCTGLAGALAGVIDTCVLFGAGSVVVHAAARMLGETSELGSLLRALGLAVAPFALGVLDPIPVLGVVAIAVKWMLGAAAATTAVGQVLRVDRLRAAVLCALGLVAGLILLAPIRWVYLHL